MTSVEAVDLASTVLALGGIGDNQRLLWTVECEVEKLPHERSYWKSCQCERRHLRSWLSDQ